MLPAWASAPVSRQGHGAVIAKAAAPARRNRRLDIDSASNRLALTTTPAFRRAASNRLRKMRPLRFVQDSIFPLLNEEAFSRVATPTLDILRDIAAVDLPHTISSSSPAPSHGRLP